MQEEFDKAVLRKQIIDELLQKHKFKTPMDEDVLYVYVEGLGYWSTEDVKDLIAKPLNDALGKDATKYDYNEIEAWVKRESYVRREAFQPTANKINLENGVLDLDNGQLLSHNPDFNFISRLDVKYVEPDKVDELLFDSKKLVDDFYKSLFDGDPDGEKKIVTLNEIVGYCLENRYPIQVAFMLIGGGENGKSTWLNLVKAFLGSRNISSVALNSLTYNRFASSALYGKMANIAADIPDAKLKFTGTFKMLTGGDPVEGEKKFQNSFTFWNSAKLLFSANKIPETEDETNAFFRRWIIIEFNNVFSKEKGNCDLNILGKITTAPCLSIVLHYAIQALKRLRQNGQFTYTKPLEMRKQEYIRNSNPIKAFVQDEIEEVDWVIPKHELYNFYIEFCQKKHYIPVEEGVFFKKFFSLVRCDNTRMKINKVRVQCIVGVKLKNKPSVGMESQTLTVQTRIDEAELNPDGDNDECIPQE